MDHEKSLIAIRSCDDYEECERVIFDILDSLGAQMLFAGKKVLIKVNLMLGAPPDLGTNTHPAVAAALVRYVRTQGGEADVGDSSGALGLTDACFHRSGIAQAVEQAKGRWINFDAEPQRVVELNGKILQRIVLPACLDDYDVIVSAPKLKVHPLMGMTGAVKNMMGIAPGAVKPWIHHRHARTLDRLAHALLDLFAAYKPALSLMDGILCREAGGSTAGRTVKADLLAASTDSIALDAACSDIIGLSRASVPILSLGGERGLGSADPDQWEVIGDGPRDFGSVPLAPAPLDKKANPVIGFIAYFLRDHAVRPVFPYSDCEDCDLCVQACPTDALSIKNGRVHRSRLNCCGCYRCVYACDKHKAMLKVAAYARKAFWKKAAGLETDLFIDAPKG